MESFGAFLLIIFIIMLYFIPAIIASNRKHPAANAITFVNLIAGWSLLGWVVCLIWAYSNANNVATTVTKKTVVNKQALSVADEIRKLDKLREEGLLTQDEFNLKKKKLLEA